MNNFDWFCILKRSKHVECLGVLKEAFAEKSLSGAQKAKKFFLKRTCLYEENNAMPS